MGEGEQDAMKYTLCTSDGVYLRRGLTEGAAYEQLVSLDCDPHCALQIWPRDSSWGERPFTSGVWQIPLGARVTIESEN